MPYIPDPNDPFYGGEKVPSLSWRQLPPGSTFKLEILDLAKMIQSREFETGKPAYWDKEKTRPIMSAVVNVLVCEGPHSVGEKRSIWAQIPSNMFMALKQAQVEAETKLLPGGTLYVRFTGEIPHKENPKLNAVKQYEAKYLPPVLPPPIAPDPFATAPQAQATPVTPAPAMRPALATWAQPVTVQQPAATPPGPSSGKRGW